MPPIADGALSGRRILIVEDEYFLADELRRILAQLGIEVVGPAATLDGGLHLLVNTQIDFAVLDVHLRDSDAFAISATLLERRIPLLFATGYGEAQISPQCANVPRLEKPFDPLALVAAITSGIRKSDNPTDSCG